MLGFWHTEGASARGRSRAGLPQRVRAPLPFPRIRDLRDLPPVRVAEQLDGVDPAVADLAVPVEGVGGARPRRSVCPFYPTSTCPFPLLRFVWRWKVLAPVRAKDQPGGQREAGCTNTRPSRSPGVSIPARRARVGATSTVAAASWETPASTPAPRKMMGTLRS